MQLKVNQQINQTATKWIKGKDVCYFDLPVNLFIEKSQRSHIRECSGN